MRHQNRYLAPAQDMLGKAAEDPLPQPAVAVAAHHQQRGMLAGGAQQFVRGVVSVRLEMANRGRDAAPAKSGHQAIRLIFERAVILSDGHDDDLFGDLQEGQCRGDRTGGFSGGLPGNDDGFGNV